MPPQWKDPDHPMTAAIVFLPKEATRVEPWTLNNAVQDSEWKLSSSQIPGFKVWNTIGHLQGSGEVHALIGQGSLGGHNVMQCPIGA